jgi:hypothetical protein
MEDPTDTQITVSKLLGYELRKNSNLEAWQVFFRNEPIAIAYTERFFDNAPKHLLWIVPHHYEDAHMSNIQIIFGKNYVI